MKKLGMFRIFLKIFPEGENEIVDGTGGGVDVVAPDRLQDLLAAHDFPAPVGPVRSIGAVE